MVRLRHDVPQRLDRLGELGGIPRVRGQGVGEEEDGQILARRVGRLHQVIEEFEVAHVGGQTKAAASTWMLACGGR